MRAALVASAVGAARKIRDPFSKARALAAAAGVIGQVGESDLLEEALAAARRVERDPWRAVILEELAPRLPDRLREPALAAAYKLTPPESRARALARLAGGEARGSDTGVLEAAVASARRIEDTYRQSRVLAELALQGNHGLGDTILDQALAAARAVPSEHWRAMAGSQLARIGSEQIVRDLLIDDQHIESDSCRLHALADLAPYAPEDALEALVDTLLSASLQTSQQEPARRVLERSALSLPPTFFSQALKATSQLDDEFQRLSALETLGPYLPMELVPLAIDVARGLSSYGRQRALHAIRPRLSPGPIEAALDLLGPAPEDVWSQRDWARSAAALGPYLPEPAVASLMQAATPISDSYARAILLTGLASGMPAPGSPDFEAALVAIHAVDWGYWRNELLLALLPILPGSLIPELAEIARQTEDPGARVAGVLQMLDRLPTAERGELIDTAVKAARAIEGEFDRVEALVSLAPRLAESQLSEALAAARGMEGGASWRLLVGLAPHLRGALLDTALVEARSLEVGDYQSRALVAIAAHLGAAQRPSVLLEALRSAQLGDSRTVAQIAAELAERVAETLLPEVLSLARSERDPIGRAGALLSLVTRLSEPVRSSILLEALAAARAIQGPGLRSVRAAALAEVAWHSAEPHRGQLFEEAVAAACAQEDWEGREAILEAMAERYAGDPALATIIMPLSADLELPPPYSAQDARQAFMGLGAEEQRKILDEAFALIPTGARIREDAFTHRWDTGIGAAARPPAYLWILRWLPGAGGAWTDRQWRALARPHRAATTRC
jgi:hypothetical protein